jgi:hypothetical protein
LHRYRAPERDALAIEVKALTGLRGRVVGSQAMTEKRSASLLALCFAVAIAIAPSGCSYQGAIKGDFNKRPVASRSTKIPLRVGVVPSSEFMEKVFVQNGADRDMTIQVQPSIADAIYAEMANVFEAAVRLAPAEIGGSNVDLLMFPTYTYTTIDSNRFFKTFTMKQELLYRFTDRQSSREVAALHSEDVLEYSQPGSARTAGWIGVASMFLLTPITIPLETNTMGNHAVELVEASLRKMIQNQTDQVYVNRNLFSSHQ